MLEEIFGNVAKAEGILVDIRQHNDKLGDFD